MTDNHAIRGIVHAHNRMKPRVEVTKEGKHYRAKMVWDGRPLVIGEGRSAQEAIGDLLLENRLYVDFVEIEAP